MQKLNDYQNGLIENYLSDDYKKLNTCIYEVTKVLSSSEKYDDFCGAAEEGLIKAAKRYDPKKNIKFNTFATMTVKNALKTYLTWTNRKKRKSETPDLSLDAPLGEDDDLLLAEKIADNYDFEKRIVVENYIGKIFKELNSFERKVTKLMMDGYTDDEIAQRLNREPKEIKNAKKIYKSTKVLIAGQGLLNYSKMGEYYYG